jgi:hypothetical protein
VAGFGAHAPARPFFSREVKSMSGFLLPQIRFVIKGDFGNDIVSEMEDRNRAVLATLLDYLRRKELNYVAEVKTVDGGKTQRNVQITVQPEETIYDDVLPERVPSIVDDHLLVEGENVPV